MARKFCRLNSRRIVGRRSYYHRFFAKIYRVGEAAREISRPRLRKLVAHLIEIRKFNDKLRTVDATLLSDNRISSSQEYRYAFIERKIHFPIWMVFARDTRSLRLFRWTGAFIQRRPPSSNVCPNNTLRSLWFLIYFLTKSKVTSSHRATRHEDRRLDAFGFPMLRDKRVKCRKRKKNAHSECCSRPHDGVSRGQG